MHGVPVANVRISVAGAVVLDGVSGSECRGTLA
jgi:hypothetical protein